MIEAIILCALFGTFILLAFIKGVELGAKLNRNERIEIKGPINSFKEKVKERKESKELTEAQEIMKINLENIDNYDGTSIGQKDIPR